MYLLCLYLLCPQLSQSGVFAVSSVESVWYICCGLTGLVSSTALHWHWADLYGITLVFAACVTRHMKGSFSHHARQMSFL